MVTASEGPVASPGWAARRAMGVVRLYQWVPASKPSPCRYVPSCSNYALDAFEIHGFFRGLWLTTRRLGRCHPWGGQGWDPVPCAHTGSHPVPESDAR
jgi:uncharacterized protein